MVCNFNHYLVRTHQVPDAFLRIMQWCTELEWPLQDFHQIMQEIMQLAEFQNRGIYFEAAAIQELRQAGEAYLVGLFEDVNLILSWENRFTATKEDLQLAKRLCDQVVDVQISTYLLTTMYRVHCVQIERRLKEWSNWTKYFVSFIVLLIFVSWLL